MHAEVYNFVKREYLLFHGVCSAFSVIKIRRDDWLKGREFAEIDKLVKKTTSLRFKDAITFCLSVRPSDTTVCLQRACSTFFLLIRISD